MILKIARLSSLVRGAAAEFLFGEQRKVPWLKLKVINLYGKVIGRHFQKNSNDYLNMQKRAYEVAASAAVVRPGEIKGDIVAAVDWHFNKDMSADEGCLLRHVPKEPVWVALEYGCGPGRNMVRFRDRFSRIDGVDISEQNLKNAKAYLAGVLSQGKMPQLFITEGSGTGGAPKAAYDFAFSTICLQHICVWEVRDRIFRDLFLCLKPGGYLAFQMGFSPHAIPLTVGYRDNHYAAGATNGMCDTRVSEPRDLEQDLSNIGFIDFQADIVQLPKEISSVFKQWIYVNVRRPLN